MSPTRVSLPAPPAPGDGVETEFNLQPPSDVCPLIKAGGKGVVNFCADRVWDKPWRGFGTSLSWFANWVGRVPQDQLDDILDLLFDPVKGMGFNVVRFNIGGGCNSDVTLKNLAAEKHYRFLPGYKPTEDGPYNWGADQYQRNMLLGAIKRGADVLSAISYAPPWWMSVSGCTAGAETGLECNLKKDYFGSFADYLTEVVKHYKEAHNVTFESLEPINEPADGGWKKGGGQEGCSFNVAQQDELLPIVHAKLAEKCPGVALAANDSWALNVARDLNKFSPETLRLIQRINAHGYIGIQKQNPPQHLHVAGQYKFLAQLSHKMGGVEVWQTEWCPILHAAKHDLDLALVMARYIVQGINFADFVVWCYWQSIDSTPRFSVITIRWHPKLSTPHGKTKKFWVLKQLVAAIPPGALRVAPTSEGECEHCVTAFFDPKRSVLSCVVVNQENQERELNVHVKGFKTTGASTIQVQRTSLTEDAVSVPLPAGHFGTDVTINFAPRSLTTVVFTHVTR